MRHSNLIRIEREATCKRCGQTGLGWVKSAKGKWYLCETLVDSVEKCLVASPFQFHDCAKHRAVIAKISGQGAGRGPTLPPPPGGSGQPTRGRAPQ